MEIPGVGGSTMKPLGKENPGGWGVKLEKTLRGGRGGMDIFWNHTLTTLNPYMGSSWDPFLPLKSPTGCS